MDSKLSVIIGIVTAMVIGSAFLPFLDYIPIFQSSTNQSLVVFGTMLVPVLILSFYSIFKSNGGK